MNERQQAWRDDDAPPGRILVLSRNPVSEALEQLAAVTGRAVHVIEEDDGGPGVSGHELTEDDAVILCDHDAPDAPGVLRTALASAAGYVAMLASRRRSEGLLEELRTAGVDGIASLHVPAGLDIGGKGPGDIALSVLAEVVAWQHGREGGPMRAA